MVSLLDFMSVRAKGEPLKIVMAMEQRPLAAVIALKKSGIERPRDLGGRLVGTTGVLSDDAGVKWMVKHDGGDPASVRLINIGFNTAQEIIAGNVDAAFGFWSQEGVQVAAHHPATVMRLNDYGAPPYPELIVFAREDFLAREPGTVRGFLRAVVRGYDDAISKPDVACAAMAARVEGETTEGLKTLSGRVDSRSARGRARVWPAQSLRAEGLPGLDQGNRRSRPPRGPGEFCHQ